MLTHQPNHQLSGVHREKDLSEVADILPLRGYCNPMKLLFFIFNKVNRER